MKERPIIFSGPMVRAIIEGRKTMTRRVIAHQHLIPPATDLRGFSSEFSVAGRDHRCPYGQPGDRLWVRETWHPAGRFGTEYLIEYKANESERTVDAGFDGPTPAIDAAIYRHAWRPSIHMPRWASRLTLEVVSVRVERLQDISEEDTDAELFGGDYPHAVRPDLFPDLEASGALSMQECFARVWDDINDKKPGRAWADNPWVWVIEFKRVES